MEIRIACLVLFVRGSIVCYATKMWSISTLAKTDSFFFFVCPKFEISKCWIVLEKPYGALLFNTRDICLWRWSPETVSRSVWSVWPCAWIHTLYIHYTYITHNLEPRKCMRVYITRLFAYCYGIKNGQYIFFLLSLSYTPTCLT